MILCFLVLPLTVIFLGLIGFNHRYLPVLNMFFLTFLSLVNLYECVLLGSTKKFTLITEFVPVNSGWSSLEIYLDFYSSNMVFVVCFISSLVHLYSLSYMKGDPRIFTFMIFLTLFTFFMILFVVSFDYVQLFIGWEGVGLTSYLLVNFWHTRPAANKASLKALLVNRFGDYFLLLALFVLADQTIYFSSSNQGFELSVLLCLASFAKSAQLGFHTWLADAMEGPTPVSALIHAATMVTAGIFLLVRSSTTVEASYQLLLTVGSLTAVFAGLTAMFQYDIKRVIAYSTCAQLGYMFVALGAGSVSLSFYHLINHAYFKALLFLSAGLVIHQSNTQDLRRMGGLRRRLPLVYVSFVVGNLSLCGFPFFSGYYSKDGILEFLFLNQHYFPYGFLLLASYLTVFYSVRVVQLAFFGPQHRSSYQVDLVGSLTLVVLFFFSIFNGYLSREFFLSLNGEFQYNLLEVEYAVPLGVKLIPFYFLFLGVYFQRGLSKERGTWPLFLARRLGFDLLDSKLVQLLFRTSYGWYQNLERGLLEESTSTGGEKWTFFVFERFYQSGWVTLFLSWVGLAVVVGLVFYHPVTVPFFFYFYNRRL